MDGMGLFISVLLRVVRDLLTDSIYGPTGLSFLH